ncbi:MAG: arsenate reductase ArsC [Burkholderiaceae bacterium]
MNQSVKHVLFICMGNSARGLIAEALLNVRSKGLFHGHSAGVHPGGLINPFAAELIAQAGYPVERLRCKRWEEFTGPNASRLDYVICLCDQVQGIPQPEWPGNPIVATWDIEDPTSTTGSIDEKRQVFQRVSKQIEEHIDLFLMLPHESFDRDVLRQELNDFPLLCTGRGTPADKALREDLADCDDKTAMLQAQ